MIDQTGKAPTLDSVAEDFQNRFASKGWLIRCHINFPESPHWHDRPKPWWGCSAQQWGGSSLDGGKGWIGEKIIAHGATEIEARMNLAKAIETYEATEKARGTP